jgi:capsular exopolysaccharide synthesis family protein
MESKAIKINFKEEIFKYLRFWYIIVISIFFSLIAAYFYARYNDDSFQTTAKVQILDNSNSDFKLPTDGISIFGDDKVNLENEVEIMKSSRILGLVIDNLNLTTEIYSVGTIKTNELWIDAPFAIFWAQEKDTLDKKSLDFDITITKNGYQVNNNSKEYKSGETNFSTEIPFKLIFKADYPIKRIYGKSYYIALKTKKDITKNISKSIKIDYVGNKSEILKITYDGLNPDKTNATVNALVNIFNNDGMQDRQLVFKKTIEFVDNRFEYLFNELDSIENSKVDFKKQNQISFLETDAALSMQVKQQSQTSFDNANTQIALSKIMAISIEKSNSLELLPPNIGIDNKEINNLVDVYNTLILKRNKFFSNGGGDSNPTVQAITKEAQQVKNNIKASIIGYQKTLEYSKNELSKVSLSEKSKYGKMPNSEKSLRDIDRQQTIKENLYVLLLQKREEASINLAILNPTVKVVDYAAEEPTGFGNKAICLIAIFLGLILPLIGFYIYFLFDTKIQTKEEIETILPNIPVIAEIPYIKGEHKLVEFLDRSILSESFRILRTNINYLVPLNNSGSVIYVTSTVKGEGKTFVSVNLAITLSTLGKKVVLIGADLRNPQLHKTLNLQRSNEKGVANYLVDDGLKISDIKAKNLSHETKFDIIFSGVIPPNPAELMSNGRFEMLLKELKLEYDYIIVDTAPTLLVTDTTLITDLADATLYVTRANYTEKKLLKFISNLKDLNAIKNMGIILNNVGENKGYGYSSNYGYGYGYENEIQKTPLQKIKNLFGFK